MLQSEPTELIYNSSLNRLKKCAETLSGEDQQTLELLFSYLANTPHAELGSHAKEKAISLQTEIINAFLELIQSPNHYKKKVWPTNKPTNQSYYFSWARRLPVWIIAAVFVPAATILTFKACCFLTALGLVAAATMPIALFELATVCVLTASMILTPILSISALINSASYCSTLLSQAKNSAQEEAKYNAFANNLSSIANHCQDLLLQPKTIQPSAPLVNAQAVMQGNSMHGFHYHSQPQGVMKTDTNEPLQMATAFPYPSYDGFRG